MTSPDIARRRQALVDAFPQWTPSSLGRWLDNRAERYGSRPLVITDDRVLTYAETAEWSDRLAAGLVELGIRPGDHVGVLMANYPEFVPIKFAIAKVGGVAVPMNFLYRAAELEYVLAQAECRLLITMTGFAGLDYLAMLDEIASRLPLLNNVIQLSTDGRVRNGLLTVDELSTLAEPTAGADVDPGAVGDILYTSGTTGSPKGVLITHDAVLRTAYASALTRAFGDGRRILFSLPCYHMFGYVEGLLAATVVGGAVVLQTSFDPRQYLAGVERHRATDILCVPTMTVAILEHPDRASFDLSSLEAVLSGAAPGPVWLWERVRAELGATEIVTGYGMTECGGAMTLTLPEDAFELTSTTVGRPKMAGVAGLPGGGLTEYRTVDPETGEPLPAGATGELVSRGPTNMLGFWAKPDETAHGLRDGWVFSGDLGRVRPDGYLEVTGRSKELYKSGGELVMPKEIEELLTAHPEISQAYLIGVPDERWGDAGCACIVKAPGATIDEQAVIELCKSRLARFKVPRHVVFLDAHELPTTPTGKVQKFRLVAQVQQRLEQYA
ncbi:class I adenylate-forming enzyme family protein [Antrihabitans stalactiti]|uniref:AMP-binding protein n=1 Tax=Antrihabitans stalactiti TaxID=2584121 RepID=A0A848KAZ1_9NOCA|nr:AMP-binding protein [Antrihabitans stalactiti]NMN93862.1 AMP-binding protein [Antrihabitans stalactiti]